MTPGGAVICRAVVEKGHSSSIWLGIGTFHCTKAFWGSWREPLVFLEVLLNYNLAFISRLT